MEELVEGSNGEVLAGRFKGFAEQEIARGVVGDSQRKAVPAIAELELAPRFRGGRLLKSAHQRSFGAAPVESGVPVARLWAVRPKRNPSKPNPAHKVYPYLLRGKVIDRPNQVWATDITYIPMRRGFLYLVAIIDWATRRVLSWRLFNTRTAGGCAGARGAAAAPVGQPASF